MRDGFLLWGQRCIERGAWFFAPFGALFSFAVFLKNLAYDRKWIRVQRVGCPVVSIGNIVAGGTGKTPLVHLLGKQFSDRKIAILSRGYGNVPDEPLLLQRRLKSARVYVGKDRVALAKRAEKEGAELIILDDGFQYRSLHRDLDLVLLKGHDPLGKGHYLPWGFLRDSPKRLRQADWIFASGKKLSEADIELQVQVDRIVSLQGEEISSLQGHKVAIFSGIANPSSFKKTVESLGAHVILEWVLADHGEVKGRDLSQFMEKAASLGAQSIVCTEKDAVKILDIRGKLPLYYLEVSLSVVDGEAEWENLIAKIRQKIDNQDLEPAL